MSAKPSGWLQNLWTDAGIVYHCIQTPVRNTSRCDQRLEAAPHWHIGKHNHKTSSTKQLVNAESGYMQAWGKMTSLWTSAKLKPALFSANILQNRLFLEPLTVYGKDVVSRHFHRSYLKANKVSKSEGTRKVKYADHFWKCADAVDRKTYQQLSMLAKVGAFFRHSVVTLPRLAEICDCSFCHSVCHPVILSFCLWAG